MLIRDLQNTLARSPAGERLRAAAVRACHSCQLTCVPAPRQHARAPSRGLPLITPAAPEPRVSRRAQSACSGVACERPRRASIRRR
eukprot:12759376-Alexandrium_andersonii.AAC.1